MNQLSRTSVDADFIAAGDDVLILDGNGDMEAQGVLVDGNEETGTVNVDGEWLERPFDRLAHPDSPAGAAAGGT